VLKDYVDVEGAGESTTTITCACGSNTSPYTDPSSATVRASGPILHSEIRFLSIENTGGNANATGMWTGDVDAFVSIVHVSFRTDGGGDSNYGIVNVGSKPTISWVSVETSGALTESIAIVNNSSSPAMDNVTVSAAGGANTTRGIYNFGSSPLMTNVDASAAGSGLQTFGIFNFGSSPMMSDVTARAVGTGVTTVGVINQQSSPKMSNLTASAAGSGGSRVGILSDSSVVTMHNVTAGATGAAIAIDSTNSFVVIHDSFAGSATGIHRVGGKVIAFDTTIAGGTTGGVVCYNAMDDSLNPYVCA